MNTIIGALAALALTLLAFQSQEAINVEQRVMAENLERRVTKLEQTDASGRLRVIESDMYEVKWLARGTTGAVLTQILAMVMNRRRERG